MEKWEQELERQVNLSLPADIDQKIQLTLNQLIMKRKTKAKLRYGMAAAAASLVFAFGLSSLSPAVAEAMKSLPWIGSVFERVGDVGMKRGSQLQLATQLGQQVQIGDQAVTFTESLYDGSNINLGWIAPSTAKDPMAFVKDVVFTVDGKMTGYGLGASGERLEDGTYAGTLSIHVNEPLPDSFVLGIRSSDQSQTFARFPVERRGESRSFAIAETKTWHNLEMTYEDVALYPTTTEISFEIRNANDPHGLGWEFQILDEKGRVLQPISGHGGGTSPDKQRYHYFFEPLDAVPRQLTIKPYTSSSYSTTKVSGEWKGAPITLAQGKAGSVTVLDERLENDQLTLTYEVAGARIFEQANSIWLEDSKGSAYYPDGTPIRVHGSGNRYQITYSNVSKIDAISICTPQFNDINYLEELVVTVNLQP